VVFFPGDERTWLLRPVRLRLLALAAFAKKVGRAITHLCFKAKAHNVPHYR
jgi:hypothetical protein